MRHLFSYVVIGFLALPAFVHAQDEPKKEPAKKFVVPFELIKTQHMVVSVKVNGKGPYRLVFDTGAPDSLVSTKVANEAKVYDKDHKKPFFSLFGAGQVKLKQVELGDLKADDLSAMVLDHPTVQAISNFVGPIEGILGFTFYARYKMSIDYEKKQMTFEPNNYEPGDVMKQMLDRFTGPDAGKKKAPILAPAGLLGIRVGKDATDEEAGVTVKDVLADSPAAAAGLKVGDRLLTLDGRWTDTVIDCYLAATLLRPGTPATAKVLRDGKKLTLKLTVRAGL
jgi:hypothetical protein